MKLLPLLTLLFFLSTICQAQKTKTQRCVPYGKTKKNYSTFSFKTYAEAEAGLSFPIIYRNPDARLKEGFSVNTKPLPYLGLNYNLCLSDKLELFGGLRVLFSKHGLQHKYSDGTVSVSTNQYASSNLFRLSIGISVIPFEKLRFSLSPVFVYNSNYANRLSNSTGFEGGGGLVILENNWNGDKFYSAWHTGLDSKLTFYHIFKKVDLNLIYNIDFAPSAPVVSEITLTYNNEYRHFSGFSQPYLMYFGAGISYRFLERSWK